MKVGAIILAIILVVSTITLLPPTPAYSIFGTSKNLSNSATDSILSSGKANQIAVSSSNVYVVWEESSGPVYDIYFSGSPNGGTTFLTPINISNDALDSLGPQIAIGLYIHVIWESANNEIFYVRSTDNGASFTSPTKLSDTSVTAKNPRIAASGSTVLVAWEDIVSGNSEILARTSTDNGATFSTTRNVSADSDDSTMPSVAIGSDLHIAWRSYNGTATFVFYSRSTDTGASYESSRNMGFNEGTSEGPEIASSGPFVFLPWLDDSTGNVDTFHRYSSDSGGTFASATNISNNAGDSSGLIITLTGSLPFIAWSDTTNTSGGDVTIALSSTGFVSSSDSHTWITTDASANPRIALFGTFVYLFWQECDISSICDIYYRPGTHNGSTITFDDAVNLTDDTEDSFHPHAVGSSDTAFVAWTSSSSPGEIMFAKDPAEEPPVADAGEDQTTLEGLAVSLDGGESFDIDDDTLSYSWEQTAGTSVTLTGANTVTPSFTAPQVSSTDVLTFQVTVTTVDGSDNDTVNVTVNDMTGILNLSDNPADSALPSLAASGGTVYSAWYEDDDGDYDIMFSRSTDGGTTFSAPVELSNDATDSIIPTVAATGNDVYVIWEDATTISNHEIFLRKSTDNGATFGSVVNVSNDADNSQVPHMALSGANVHATWESGASGDKDVMFSTSADGGAAFSTPINLSANAGNSILPIATSSGASVLVTWSDDTPGNYDIMYAVSTNSGASFGSTVNLSSNSGDSGWPWASFSGSNAYLAWHDSTSGNYEIMFSVSTNGGSTFSTPVNLSNNSGDSLDPFVSATSDRVFVVWDNQSSPADILFTVSTDDGTTFASPTNLSNNSEDSLTPQVVQAGDYVPVIWEDLSSGNPEIFLTQLVFADRTLSDTSTLSDSAAASVLSAQSVTDSITSGDAITSSFSASRSMSESIATSDDLDRTSTASNDRPTANAGSDQIMDEGDLVTLDGAGSTDPEDDTLTFSWTQTGGPSVTLSGANTATPTFTAPSTTSDTALTFELVVNDGSLSSLSDSVTVTVTDLKGTLTIKKVIQDTDDLLAGSEFTITPSPFTLTGSLVVEDNGTNDSDSTAGIITLDNAEFGTFKIEETVVPAGFVRLVQDVVVSVHSTQQSPVVIIENKLEDDPVDAPEEIPAPDLTSEQFNNFILKGASVGGKSVTTVNDLPPALLSPDTSPPALPEEITFATEAPSDSTTQDLADLFTIPTYITPEALLAEGNVFILPPIVIGHDDSENEFLMTPFVSETLPGMTLLFDQLIATESGDGQLKTIEMTFSDSGQASDVAFSVTITDTVPKDTPEPPKSLLDTSAMFVTVDFVGDFSLFSSDEVTQLSFSTEDAFEESPRVSILVDKKLNIKKLSDGCPDVSLYFFDEEEESWEKISKPDREKSLDTSQYCGYVLETGHWSKFAVGGVKISANVLQSIGGGGSKVQVPTSASGKITAGADASTSISVPGGGKVTLSFENVVTGGEVKVTKPTLSQKSNLFTSVGEKSATLSIDNNDRSVTYTTAGELLDLDLSSIEFTGEVETTISYDPSLLPDNVDESEIRFLHNADSEWEDVTSSVNIVENTVTGKLLSASPVIAAIIDDGTFDASYFEKNPLEKISVLSIDIDAPLSSGPASLRLPVELSATFKNMQKTDQDYVLIAQIVDENDYTKSINWLTGNLDRGTETTISFSTNLVKGQYTVKFFVWNEISQPTALSPVIQQELRF